MNNYYNKNDLIDKYLKIIFTSKIVITNRIKDLKIDIININKDEIDEITNLLMYILYNIIDSNQVTTVDYNSLKKNKFDIFNELFKEIQNL